MINAYVGDCDFGRSVAIAFTKNSGDVNGPHEVMRILAVDDRGVVTVGWDELEPTLAIPAPTLILSDYLSRALLDGLTRFYQGSSEVLAVRRDLETERKRVTELLTALMQCAQRK